MKKHGSTAFVILVYFIFLVLVVILTVIPSIGQDLEDKNCGDFDTVVQAQGTFLAAQQITDQRDYHGLDGDGNGIACEGINIVKRRTYTDTSDSVTHYINYRSMAHVIKCPTTDPFIVGDYYQQLRLATVDTVAYNDKRGVWNRMECMHTLGILETSR